jgi:acetylxylan esterase
MSEADKRALVRRVSAKLGARRRRGQNRARSQATTHRQISVRDPEVMARSRVYRDWTSHAQVPTASAIRALLARIRTGLTVCAAVATGLLIPKAAHAASLSGPITGWASGVPSYISMYEYVPSNLAANPPILVVSHYCGGNAAGVFGEAQGGGIVAAADKYGFVMIFPQTSNNCWDVGSTKSLTHDGGGDTQAIAEMVKYSITKHSANAARVYATGTSSGAMMTEALLAVYPDVFKGGAEFSGVPAGCWAASYSASNQWSGPCAGGQVSHTGAQWGDLVRAMYAGYSGHRPRVQLWHGMADTTINFNNQTEAIKGWIDVLGLSTTPTSTASQTITGHQWTRQSWQDSCGFTVLDAWAETNGPHGTDANLNATYVIPFLDLDKAGATDPEQCGAGGSGAGGSSAGGSSAGGSSAGGSSAAGAGGNGGNLGVAGSVGTGGSSGNASSAGGGAAPQNGGTGGSSVGLGGSSGSTFSAAGSGGSVHAGGSSVGAGGSSASGTSGAGPSGISGSSTSNAGSAGQADSSSSGCSCHLAGRSRSSGPLGIGALLALSTVWCRRRRAKHLSSRSDGV